MHPKSNLVEKTPPAAVKDLSGTSVKNRKMTQGGG